MNKYKRNRGHRIVQIFHNTKNSAGLSYTDSDNFVYNQENNIFKYIMIGYVFKIAPKKKTLLRDIL